VSEEQPFGVPGRKGDPTSPFRWGFAVTAGALVALVLGQALATVEHQILLVLIAAFGQQGLRGEEGIDPVYLGLGVLAAAVLGGALSFVAWQRTRNRLTTTELQVDSGILQRRSRRVPLARLQSVDVVRPVVARVLGLAELRLEVVGGGKTEAPLA
jgi:putative membrane protein